jgi:hypothetical protein
MQPRFVTAHMSRVTSTATASTSTAPPRGSRPPTRRCTPTSGGGARRVAARSVRATAGAKAVESGESTDVGSWFSNLLSANAAGGNALDQAKLLGAPQLSAEQLADQRCVRPTDDVAENPSLNPSSGLNNPGRLGIALSAGWASPSSRSLCGDDALHCAATRVWKAATSKADPRPQQDWVVQCLQGHVPVGVPCR